MMIDLKLFIERNYNPDLKVLDLSAKHYIRNLPILPIIIAISNTPFINEIERLYLNDNDLFGDMIWDLLPPNLKILDLSNNDLDSVAIPWSILPQDLQVLKLSDNYFQGAIQWKYLPDDLRILQIDGNPFADHHRYYGRLLELEYFPPNLTTLAVSDSIAAEFRNRYPSRWKDVDDHTAEFTLINGRILTINSKTTTYDTRQPSNKLTEILLESSR